MGDERGRGGLPKGERTQVNPIFRSKGRFW